MKTSLTPVLFLSHGAGPAAFLTVKGSPLAEVDSTSPSAAFLRNLKNLLPQGEDVPPIKSILVISAHWEEKEFTVDYQTGSTKLLYDYYGFPKESYAPYLEYPVPTDLHLARHVHELLNTNGIKNSLKPRDGGFDHGVFIPLKLAFPDADIPVVQLSLNSNLDLATHIQLGEALAPLRKEGVLIIGSGQITHSSGGSVKLPPGQVDTRAVQFTDYYKNLLESTNEHNYEENKAAFIASPSVAPYFHWNHPRTEHFVPLAVVYGASCPHIINTKTIQPHDVGVDMIEKACVNPSSTSTVSLSVRRLFHHIAMGSMATDAYIFTSAD